MNQLMTDELFAALQIVVMEKINHGGFKVIGKIPDWLGHFYSDIASIQDEEFRPEKTFIFLESFLVDAEAFWKGDGSEPLKSGLWSEIDASGNECHFEATAVRVNDRNILLIELLKIAYEDKKNLIQKARENRLNYDILVKEIQKKEILLHCIVHDLGGQVSVIHSSFELLNFEDLSPQGREFLEIGRSQSVKQAKLVREILNAFSAEVESLEDFVFDPETAPDAVTSAIEVVESLLPTFLLQKINLRMGSNISGIKESKVVGTKNNLERVVSNLLENALRHSPAGSTVTVDVQTEGEFILLTVDDEGFGVPQELSQNLFQRFVQGSENSGKAGLGLYFCRITIERWGGAIGYLPRPEGGSRFWVRLPRVVNATVKC